VTTEDITRDADRTSAEFTYDEVAYPNYVHPASDSEYACVAGRFYGWRGRDPAAASVLEIGCGEGVNLMAIAGAFPGSRCVGFDISARAVERGRRLATTSGLDNVDVHWGDLTSYPRDGERFDYILCHGVLTWVPPAVRAAVFEVIAGRLAPGGVAYIGYDALPAAASKQAIVGLLRQFVPREADSKTRVETAVTLIESLARNQHKSSRLKAEFDDIVRRLPEMAPAYFIHDWLEAHYAPMSVEDFAAAAGAVGLAYAGDVSLTDVHTRDIDAAGRHILAAAEDSLVTLAATLDVLRGSRMYRTDMLVRPEAPPERMPFPPADLSCSLLGEPHVDVADDGRRTLVLKLGAIGNPSFDDPDQVAVLEWLAARSPEEFQLAEIAASTDLAPGFVDNFVRTLAVMGVLEAHVTPAPFTVSPGERPRAGRLARGLLAEGRDNVVALRHKAMMMTDPIRRRILTLSDGSRTRQEIAEGLRGAVDGTAPTLAEVDLAIDALARLRLYEA
jgi:SAM-dependent methyltransferase